MNTTKAELVGAVSMATACTRVDVETAIMMFLRLIVESLLVGRKIEIRGFGTFYTKERQPRPARNPRTGEVVMLPTRRVARFRFSPDVRFYIDQAKVL